MDGQDLRYLSVELPEDIARWKWYGDFERAGRLISLRLAKDLPLPLRKRLELEQEILKRMPLRYIYSFEDALRRMQDTVSGATAEELTYYQDENAAEWIFVNGQVRFKDNFMENLLKTRPELQARVLDPASLSGAVNNRKILREAIREMKEAGGLAYRLRVRASLKLREEAVVPGERLRVYLPLPLEAAAQVRHFKLLSCSLPDAKAAPPDYPQRTVYMEAEAVPGQKFFVEYEFEDHAAYRDLAEAPEEGFLAEASYKKTWPADMDFERPELYRGEQEPHIRFTPYLRELARLAVGGETDPLRKARRIYDYLTTHVMYSYVRQYFTITDLPEYMASNLKGDCGIYALLFITLCRIEGIPARWQSGLYATPDQIGCHDWAQFYCEPYGWLYADASFGGAAWREGDKERWNFYFGNLDPFRIPCNREFQHEFLPPSRFLRDDPYDNQVGEAEYESRGLTGGVDYDTEQELLSIEKIPYVPETVDEENTLKKDEKNV